MGLNFHRAAPPDFSGFHFPLPLPMRRGYPPIDRIFARLFLASRLEQLARVGLKVRLLQLPEAEGAREEQRPHYGEAARLVTLHLETLHLDQPDTSRVIAYEVDREIVGGQAMEKQELAEAPN